jgi:thymidylate kinase
MIYKNDFIIRWTPLHSAIFSEFVLRLKKNKIKFFILRNYEELPEINNSKDIDLIIEPGFYKQVSIILKEVLIYFKITHYRTVQYERVHCFYAINLEKKFSIHIDLIEGFILKGFEIFSFNELYKQTIEYKNFRVLNEKYDVIMLLYSKIIVAKQLKPQYKEKINSLYSLHDSEINKLLVKTLGKKMSDLIIYCLLNQDYESIIKHAHNLSKDTKINVFLKYPFKSIYNFLIFILEKTYRIIYCPTKFQNFIAVLGSDGTGKSTFIDGLVKAIAFYNVSEISKSNVYHHRPTILPNLGAIGEKVNAMKEDKDFINPHRSKPTGFISSLFRMTYYWLDYVIGIPIKLRKDVQFDRFTIYDRYIYDFLIDPYRSRINLPFWIRKIFTITITQPRLVFVLLTDAETIYYRKQELTIDEINRQFKEYSKLASSHKRFVVLDSSQSPEKLVNEAISIIIKKFSTVLK